MRKGRSRWLWWTTDGNHKERVSCTLRTRICRAATISWASTKGTRSPYRVRRKTEKCFYTLFGYGSAILSEEYVEWRRKKNVCFFCGKRTVDETKRMNFAGAYCVPWLKIKMCKYTIIAIYNVCDFRWTKQRLAVRGEPAHAVQRMVPVGVHRTRTGRLGVLVRAAHVCPGPDLTEFGGLRGSMGDIILFSFCSNGLISTPKKKKMF